MASAPQTDEDLARRLVIAYHEAGHAVAHRVAGGKVSTVEISGDGSGGVTSTAEDGPTADTLTDWLVMILAGSEAEARFLVRHHGHWRTAARRHARPGSRSDMANFRRYATGSGISESTARAAAERLVRTHWRRIEKVAALLVKKGRITGRQV